MPLVGHIFHGYSYLAKIQSYRKPHDLEPYLLANGYIERTARGRIATQKSYEHFRLKMPGEDGLFE